MKKIPCIECKEFVAAIPKEVTLKEELENQIKYQLERKPELMRLVRVGEDAKKELEQLEGKLKVNMCQYLYNNI